MATPLVSIVCITYNHEPYLRKALDGFLMQQTTFPFEIILAEDCSTDGTRRICEDYKAKYPERINYIWSEKNVGVIANERRAMKAARGKYVAFCEGDDYWTVPDKLQRQVSFLEEHADYSVTFHRCQHLNVSTGSLTEDDCSGLFMDGESGVDLDIPTFFSHWYTQPLTMVYRVQCLDLDDMLKYRYYRDMHQIYHLLRNGRGYLFCFNGGIRLVHDGGMHSVANEMNASDIAVKVAEELVEFNEDNSVTEFYLSVLKWRVSVLKRHGLWWQAQKHNAKLFAQSKNLKWFIKGLVYG